MEQNIQATQQTSVPGRGSWVQSVPVPHLPAWLRNFLRNRKAALGLFILLFFIFVASFAHQIAPLPKGRGPNAKGDASRVLVVPRDLSPTSKYYVWTDREEGEDDYYFGTTHQGQDVFMQVVHGSRTSLVVGFGAGTIIITMCIIVGITAGYLGGIADESLSLLTNVVLVLPGVPLIIVVAGWVDQPGPLTIMIVLSVVSWAFGARVLRSQTLILRNSEFVAAARVSGEPSWRIILFEILPNMASLVVSSWIGAVVFVILTEAALSFIGLGNPNQVSWGASLYWARNDQALINGRWWTFVPPGVCVALVGFSLTLINYGIDEITNPRLRGEGGS